MGRKAKQIIEPIKKTFEQIVKTVGRYSYKAPRTGEKKDKS